VCAAGGRLCSLPTCPALLPALAACWAWHRGRGRGPRCSRARDVARSAAGSRRARGKRGGAASGAAGARGGACAGPVDGQVDRERARAHAASLRPRALLTTAGRIQPTPQADPAPAQAACADGLLTRGPQSARTRCAQKSGASAGAAGARRAHRRQGPASALSAKRTACGRGAVPAGSHPCTPLLSAMRPLPQLNRTLFTHP